jgi:RNA polymerase sigma factor (sigma-70 family)
MTLFREDAQLLAAFREGRREALERVYRAYARQVAQFVRALARETGHASLGQTSAVVDLVQEVFIRAFSVTARREYDGLRDFAPYLMTIARNCFVDALRARGREVLKNPEDLASMLADSPPEPGGFCDAKTLAVLTRYIDELPAPLKGVHERRFVLGQSQEEACSALGLSRRKLRTAEARLLRGLRKALLQAGISLRPGQEAAKDFSTRISASAVASESES